jgi:O-antigen/teichoic acid export membrane protein
MKAKVFQLLKHSAVYSFGNIALKGMGIITLPIYASHLTQTEFGAFGILDITIIVLSEMLSLGQANSIIYFNNTRDYRDKNKSVFFTISMIVLIANIIFGALTGIIKLLFPQLINPLSLFSIYLPLICLISIMRAFNSVFMNKLRADEKSLIYTVITLVKIAAFICAVIFTVVHLKLSVTGIMYSYLFSEVFILVLLCPVMFSKMKFEFDKEIGRKALTYGIPLIFAAIGIYILNLSDRFMIAYYLHLKAVGIYDFGYRIAGTIQMFLIMPFNQALLPSTYKEYKKPGDKRYYSKLMTYMCFVIIWGSVALSMFGNLLVKLLGNNNFNGAEVFVPIIVLAYIFSSMRNVASTGMLLSGKTSYIGIITVLAGFLNVGLNIILLPRFGVIAAAYTTLIAFIVFYFVTKKISDRYYKIVYENDKILMLMITGIILYLLSSFLPVNGIFLSAGLRIVLILCFPFIMYLLNFYEKVELQTIKVGLKKLRSPIEIKHLLTNLLTNDKES